MPVRQIVIWILLSDILNRSYSQVQGQAKATTAACLQNVTFLHFIPCWRENERIHNRSAALERLVSCDLLARAAVDLAVERVNENREIFASSRSRDVRVVPLFPDINDTINLQTVTDAFRFVKSDEFFGVIGPSDPGEAAFWAPIFQRSNLMTVSYNITSSEPDKVDTFYRTLPSDRAANVGRLSLINRFKWFRIATISSQERYYVQMREDFISLYNRIYRDKVLWPTSFRGSPDSALHEIHSRHINIIFGFFDSKLAREVLCRAKSLFAGPSLVSADHAWILPAYYNPNWWKLPAGMTSDCSDEDMRAILESVIFIDTVKYPPMDLSLDEFRNLLVSKALDLFPSLAEEDLKPYLLRSRATNAYDAVTLLARSVGVAFEQAGGDYCNNVNVIQIAFEKVFMECEYCRLNSGCFLNQSETKKCQEFCGSEYTPTVLQKSSMTYPNPGLRSYRLLNHYGQVSYSQFIDGEECIVGLLWNGTDNEPGNVMGHIYGLEEDFEGASCVLQLNLSRTLRNIIINGTHCPMTFQWRGSVDPPRSHHLLLYKVPLYQMVIIGVLTGIGFILAVIFLVFNIVWRKNKAVKGTSPWLNVVLIVGILTRLPVPLMDGLIQSSTSMKYEELMHPVVCYFRELNHYFGGVIFISVLIMKNWRLYRIFSNKEMKFIGKGLTDRWLFLGISLWSLPIVLALIIRFSLNLQLKVVQSLNERLQFEKYGSCRADMRVASGTEGFMDIYNTILSFLLLGLSFITSLIRSPSTFHREAVLSLRAVIVILVPVSSVYIVAIFLNIYVKLTNLESILWIEIVANICLPMLIMLILFGPSVYVVVKRCKKVKKGRQSRELVDRYHQLLKEKEDLKIQLSMINEMKSNLLVWRQKQLETSSQLGDEDTKPFKSKTDTVDSPMERDNKLKISSVDPFTEIAESSRQERKSSQCMENVLFISESPTHCEGNESKGTLYTILMLK